MSKAKVIAVLGLCGIVSSPSLDAMENYDVENGLSGVNRDIFNRLCNTIGGDRHGDKENNNIKQLVGMCNEYYRWAKHNSFLINRKRMPENALKCADDLIKHMQNSMGDDKTSKKAQYWYNVHIENMGDICQMCLCNVYGPDVFSAEASAIAMPMIKDLFILNKLDEDFVKELLQYAVHTFVDGEMCTEVERRTSHDLARFLVERGAADYGALHYLWDASLDTDVIFTSEERRALTLLMWNLGGLDINYVWPSLLPNGYVTVRDMSLEYSIVHYVDCDGVEDNQFLKHMGAKYFDDLLQEEKDAAITRIAST